MYGTGVTFEDEVRVKQKDILQPKLIEHLKLNPSFIHIKNAGKPHFFEKSDILYL